MKRILLFCIFLGFVCNCFSQIISGKIQTENGSAISDVNVYLDGTKISTVSNNDGTFQLDVQGQKSGNLIFQKDHYETSIFPLNQAIGKSVKVIINPQKEIEEVVIIPYTEEAYRNFINYFLDQFIGFDREDVKIKNQRTLKFSYDKKNQFLKVKAPQTLIIENKNLGYTIQYNLINFEADFKKKSTSYLGTSFFKENGNKKQFILNRMNAYKGSMMHFLRTLYSNELEKEGFIVNHAKRIRNPKYPSETDIQKLEDYYSFVRSQKVMTVHLSDELEDISRRKSENAEFLMAILKTKMKESDFTKRRDGRLFIDFEDLLQVNYQKYYYEIKKGEFVKSSGVVTQTSFVHPEAMEFEIFPEGISSEPDQLILEGDFSRQNISKMLPLDYKLGN
ncbi:carboxypeptidase-like regulatory domain-containing protein [Epilithonimonas sp. UC225_85]|uniref:carboxypeptidase-like regulatory domain-containing protein n=1 Tax=Epilithonimonas sp. UC225_85 TaxID=3350167 RepID=UPI0036D3FD55